MFLCIRIRRFLQMNHFLIEIGTFVFVWCTLILSEFSMFLGVFYKTNFVKAFCKCYFDESEKSFSYTNKNFVGPLGLR